MKEVTLKEFFAWKRKLSHLDAMNFDTLITLPNAVEVIEKMPSGQYREMAIFGLALVHVANEQ